ncbi:hypothetical protein K443DRAFT_109628 [Laccaria amethystina LaAM-08-1]|uniref:Uncharacterized protein n=1 Tax=Laccaria amethystina LaAM-08-1 TaxID=1095629 RepID=A0A0C9XFI9_9AGAR|nr:hypothetical protein K443DRAFT_109628 [Laccaria amethystina LaAM-08-1]
METEGKKQLDRYLGAYYQGERGQLSAARCGGLTYAGGYKGIPCCKNQSPVANSPFATTHNLKIDSFSTISTPTESVPANYEGGGSGNNAYCVIA